MELENKRPLVIEELKNSMFVFDMYEEKWYEIKGMTSKCIWLWTPDENTLITPYLIEEFKKVFTQMADK